MNFSDFDFGVMARDKKTAPIHLARECLQLEILRRISASGLKGILCFKGGTALHLIFNMERYSEDLDFSLTTPVPPGKIVSMVKEILEGEEVTDCAVKRKTVMAEIRQQFLPQNFRVKLEINTDNIAPGELKTLYSEYVPTSFNLQIMKLNHMVAQKIRALMQRDKGRDLYDLWFILRTKLPVDISLVSKMAGITQSQVIPRLEKRVGEFTEKKLAFDLNPFVRPAVRGWIGKNLKSDVLQLLKNLSVSQSLIQK